MSSISEQEAYTTLMKLAESDLTKLRQAQASFIESPLAGNWYENKRVLLAFLEAATDPIDELARFNLISSTRMKAGYRRHERLNELVFYGGRWFGDTCGNMMRATEKLPPQLIEACSKVLSREEFQQKVKEIEPDLRYWMTIEGPLPAGLCCAECQEPWDISNADAFVSERSFRDVPLNEYIGWRFADAVQDLIEKNATNQIWVLQSDLALRNDKYIDHSMRTDYPALEVNGSGHIRGDQSEHIIEDGDEAYFNIWDMRHPECAKKHNFEEGVSYFVKLLGEVGFDFGSQKSSCTLHVSENKYDHDETNSWPWVTLVTPNGIVEIGWRKRVMSISIEENFGGKEINLATLFASEDVTKDQHLIHAWGRDKAIEYLTVIKAEMEKLQQS